MDNLGWHLYREVGGVRTQVAPSLIAGSAFRIGPGTPLTAGKSYTSWDPEGSLATTYWLEDIDLKRTRTMHGPFYPEQAPQSLDDTAQRQIRCSPLLPGLGSQRTPGTPISCPGLHGRRYPPAAMGRTTRRSAREKTRVIIRRHGRPTPPRRQ